MEKKSASYSDIYRDLDDRYSDEECQSFFDTHRRKVAMELAEKMLRDAGVTSFSFGRGTPRLLVNAGEIQDMWSHIKQGLPYSMRLDNGVVIEVVAGDPSRGVTGREHANLDEIEVRGTSL